MALAGVRAWAEYEADTCAYDAVICPPDPHTTDPPGAISTGPLASLELPTVEQLAEAIAATISQRINTPPELQHAQWLADTMTAAGVEMYHHHSEPTRLRVGDDNLCAISLGQEDKEFADTLRLSEFDPSELLVHPCSQTIGEAGELGGDTGHNQIRRAAIGMRKRTRKTALASLALRATGRPIYTLNLQLTAHHHNIIGGTRSTDRTAQWRKTVSPACGKIKAAPAPAPTESEAPCRHIASSTTSMPNPTATSSDPSSLDRTLATAPAATAMHGAQTDDKEELELNYEENDSTMEVDTTQGAAAETPGLADMSLDCPQRSTVHRTFRESTPNGTTKRLAELHHLTTATTELLAQSFPANQPAIAAKLASLTTQSHQLRTPQRLSIQLERHPSQHTPACKGKAATTDKLKKKPRGRSRSDGATRNRSRSKPRLSGTRGSDNELETDDDAAHPASSSHQ
eukprot:jgi/Tetstr1/440200/TSEL_028552.t1